MKYTHLTALASLLVFSTSCAWYRNLERSLVEDDLKNQKRARPVPREQYDQLLVKYEELSKKYQTLKENPGQASLVDELQSSQGNTPVETETVDLFAGEKAPAQGVIQKVPQDIESQLHLYRRGLALKQNNNSSEATKIFQQLESEAISPIKVRSKIQIGQILYGKQQYDLALQVFEDVIHKNAHSGVVLEALKYAIVCSERLGIQNKKDQYSSMLNDVFGVR